MSRIVVVCTISCLMKIVNWNTFTKNVVGSYRERLMSFGPLGIVISVCDEKKLMTVEFFKSTNGFRLGRWQEIFLF